LAVLGRLPQQQRERVIRELPLEDSHRAKLVDLAQAIGEPEDTNSWAAALSTMYPDLTGEDQQAGIQPASDQQAETVDDEPPSNLELEKLAATVATWSPPDRARRALFTLLPPCVQHGSPFPLEFWTRAARRLRDSWALDEGDDIILLARMIHRLGDPETALDLLETAKSKVTEPALRADIAGAIAEILAERGELDEALRIRREEELPVYERLGDVRSRTITWGKIADILAARGELDEALRIRREEELPVYERLGDVRSLAITWGKIADILAARGELDEALRIRREEELPVYERLGDVRSLAITWGKIADILAARGELDEALRIRREEELPVYERLGATRDLLVGRANIAIRLLRRGAAGDRDEAERLLRLALEAAERLRLPEAPQIRQILTDAGFSDQA
jgi:tetratricopeptide (TPR) repeat protein